MWRALIFPRQSLTNMAAAARAAASSSAAAPTARSREPRGSPLRRGGTTPVLLHPIFMRFFHLSILVASIAAPSWAFAADATRGVLTVKSATVGFGGKFKAGFWQPVRLTVVAGPKGAKGRLELQIADGDQAPVVYRDESRGAI